MDRIGLALMLATLTAATLYATQQAWYPLAVLFGALVVIDALR